MRQNKISSLTNNYIRALMSTCVHVCKYAQHTRAQIVEHKDLVLHISTEATQEAALEGMLDKVGTCDLVQLAKMWN